VDEDGRRCGVALLLHPHETRVGLLVWQSLHELTPLLRLSTPPMRSSVKLRASGEKGRSWQARIPWAQVDIATLACLLLTDAQASHRSCSETAAVSSGRCSCG